MDNMASMLVTVIGFLGFYVLLGILTYMIMKYLSKIYSMGEMDEDFDWYYSWNMGLDEV